MIRAPEIIKVKLPAHLLVECKKPEKAPVVYTKDIVKRLVDTETALDECSIRVKEIIRYESEE